MEEFLNASIQYSHSHLTFEIKYIKVNHLNTECIFDDGELVIQTIPLNHRVPTVGYLFKLNMITRKLNLDKMESLSIPVHEFKKLLKVKIFQIKKVPYTMQKIYHLLNPGIVPMPIVVIQNTMKQ